MLFSPERGGLASIESARHPHIIARCSRTSLSLWGRFSPTEFSEARLIYKGVGRADFYELDWPRPPALANSLWGMLDVTL